VIRISGNHYPEFPEPTIGYHKAGAIAIAVLAAAATPLSAQECTSTAQGANFSSPGNPTYQGSTTQQGCTGRTTQVYVWMDGSGYECSNENCTETSTSGNAVQSVFVVSYGDWYAHSGHQFKDGEGSWQSLGQRNMTVSGGRSPEEECNAQGWVWYEGVCSEYSPIIISTGRSSRYKLTSASEGVLFDIDGDGIAEQVAWTEPVSDVAFLALDRDGDGRITSGRELFAKFTCQASRVVSRLLHRSRGKPTAT
jgi:hypothetical protein